MDAPSDSRIGDIAASVIEARLGGRPLQQLAEGMLPGSEDEAYRVQNEVHRALAKAGLGAVVGRKIGLADQAQQAKLGLNGPATGGLFANSLHFSGVELKAEVFRSPGFECEIAFTLGKDLPSGAGLLRSELVAAVAACHAAIEIVDNRFADIESATGLSLIADDVLNAACVIGPACRVPESLARLKGTLTIDALAEQSGTPVATYGDPFTMLAWLADHANRIGRPLQAGEIILCGSVTPVAWRARRESCTEVVAQFDELPLARLRIH